MADNEKDPHGRSAEVARLGAAALGRLFEASTTTSAEVTAALLERLEAIDRSGPRLRCVLRVNDGALDEAAALDAERRAGHVRGPLHGVPMLVKDNIDTVGLGATAGSLSLDGVPPARDARLVTRLRQAGAVVLGKANLSEWANFRGRPSSSGWSAVGHQTRNPFALNRSPGGSSSGSAAGVASGLVPLAVGTETDGSILCPSAACGVVGIKPTVGLVSREGIIPISSSQDTAGPMARSVEDAVLLLEVLADRVGHDLAARGDGLRGVRIGVARDDGYFGYHPGTDAVIEAALRALAEAGAELVDPVTGMGAMLHADELIVLCAEFKAGLNGYLAGRLAQSGGGVSTRLPRTLEDVVAFNEANPEERLDLFPQDVLVRAATSCGLDDPVYREAQAANHQRTRSEGIDGVCERLRLDALVAPTMAPAWVIDHLNGDSHAGASWSQAAVAGYPSINLPVGEIQGLPVGLAIWGRAWSEATLIRIAAAAEAQISYRPVPTYRATVGIFA
ncbi:MAG: amidase [Acidimicrobiales bacterium]